MCALIFEYGMATVSWYAEFAFRRRVSMSAIGSVIVMAYWALLAAVSVRDGHATDLRRGRGCLAQAPGWSLSKVASAGSGLPAGLGDAGQLAAVRHLPEADPAQAELAEDGARTPTTRAPGVGAHGVLGLPARFGDQSLLRHQFSLNGKPRCRRSARPSSSVFAVVTI